MSLASHTEAELEAVGDEVLDSLFYTGDLLSISAVHDRIEVDVIHDDGALQADLDRRHGAGLVTVTSALRPYGG